jgi:hypothetical protein
MCFGCNTLSLLNTKRVRHDFEKNEQFLDMKDRQTKSSEGGYSWILYELGWLIPSPAARLAAQMMHVIDRDLACMRGVQLQRTD